MHKNANSYGSDSFGNGLRSLAIAVLCTLFLVNPGRAQVSTNYNFSQSAGTYSAISGGTVLWGGLLGSYDDQVSGAIAIPGFNFDGTVYNQMYVSANGFITFGSAPTGTNYTPLSSNAGYSGAIAAFGANLNSSGFTPDVRWELVGSEVVVQWTSARRFNLAGIVGLNPEGFNMQIRLNTANNTIRMVYGSISNQNSATTFQPQVGLRGANNTFPANLNNRRVGTGAENWASSLAGNANNSTMRFTSGSPAKAFTNGLTYTWTPNCTAPTASVSLTTNCATNSYTATVAVTSLGSASSVDLIGSVSGLFANDVGVGNYTTPSIAFGTSQTVTIVHNTSSVCSIQVPVTSPSGSCVQNGVCQSPTLAIPDNGCGSGNVLTGLIPITAPGNSLNTDVLFGSVDLIVAHTWNNDLEITLTSPTGQTRNLVLDRFGNGDNLGNPATCPSAVLRLRDGGTALSNANTSNVTGEYAPEQTLAGFTGNPNGLWTLRICDDAGDDLGSLVYVKLNFNVMASTNRCAPLPLSCGSAVQANSTSGAPNTLPPTACAFNGAASTGGTHWWSHTPFSNGEVVVTLCGNASFNTRLSIFTQEPSCSSPTCIAMSDDSPGCPGGSSEVRFKAQAGTTYLIAVHGSG
ncbi:MAG: proprotein convertase P-domain-containing protein, partial [Flavobacteriales bacterium]|nr:proprotein convertase P-domain-containing protein [Flavobacteriales bacterium]